MGFSEIEAEGAGKTKEYAHILPAALPCVCHPRLFQTTGVVWQMASNFLN